MFAKRFIFYSVVLFFPKLNVIYSCWRLTVFSLETPIWQRFTIVSYLRSYHSKKDRDSFDPRSQTLSGEHSTWMVDRLEKPRVVDCFFFIFYFFCLLHDWLALAVSQHEFCFFNRAWKSYSRHYRYIVTSHSCWVVNKNALLAFHSGVCYVVFRDKRGSLKE